VSAALVSAALVSAALVSAALARQELASGLLASQLRASVQSLAPMLVVRKLVAPLEVVKRSPASQQAPVLRGSERRAVWVRLESPIWVGSVVHVALEQTEELPVAEAVFAAQAVDGPEPLRGREASESAVSAELRLERAEPRFQQDGAAGRLLPRHWAEDDSARRKSGFQ